MLIEYFNKMFKRKEEDKVKELTIAGPEEMKAPPKTKVLRLEMISKAYIQEHDRLKEHCTRGAREAFIKKMNIVYTMKAKHPPTRQYADNLFLFIQHVKRTLPL